MPGDATIASLNHKMEQFESGNASPITQPEALGELVSLVHSNDVLRDGLSLQLIKLAGGFHFYRAKAMSKGSDSTEFAYSAAPDG